MKGAQIMEMLGKKKPVQSVQEEPQNEKPVLKPTVEVESEQVMKKNPFDGAGEEVMKMMGEESSEESPSMVITINGESFEDMDQVAEAIKAIPELMKKLTMN